MSVVIQDPSPDMSEEPSAEHEDELTPGEIFHILQNRRRRLVLKYLQDKTEPVRMRDVAEQVAAWEHDTSVAGLHSKERQRVYIPLYQMHLPKLAEMGVIEYRQARGVVTRTPLADVLDPYLDVEAEELQARVQSDHSNWSRYYFGATVLGAVLLLGAVIEVPILAAMSGIALAVTILVVFSLLTISSQIARPA